MTNRDGPACPRCREVALFQKASAIYEAQTFRVRGTGVSRGVGLGLALSTRGVVPVLTGSVGRGSATGIQQSDLAARLAPPRPPLGTRPTLSPPLGVPGAGEALLWGGLLAASLLAYFGMVGLGVILQLQLPIVLAVPLAGLLVAGAAAAGVVCGPSWARSSAAARLEQHARATRAWAEWEDAQARWGRLWHCSRCGTTSEIAD